MVISPDFPMIFPSVKDYNKPTITVKGFNDAGGLQVHLRLDI